MILLLLHIMLSSLNPKQEGWLADKVCFVAEQGWKAHAKRAQMHSLLVPARLLGLQTLQGF